VPAFDRVAAADRGDRRDRPAARHLRPDRRQALFVTGKTVETHLTHVYRKLQIPDRTGLATALRRPARLTGGPRA
jgi:hypothetical protein